MRTLAEVAGELKRRRLSALPALILVTDADRLPDPRDALRALPPGNAVLLRHYRDPHRAALARALAVLARARQHRLLIADDPDLARDVGAGGIHLPARRLRHAGLVRRRYDWMVTAAAHSWLELSRAASLGVDAALVSPVFETSSHPGACPLGLHRFAALARFSPVPVYALGGIAARNAVLLRATDAVGIAAVGGLTPPIAR